MMDLQFPVAHNLIVIQPTGNCKCCVCSFGEFPAALVLLEISWNLDEQSQTSDVVWKC